MNRNSEDVKNICQLLIAFHQAELAYRAYLKQNKEFVYAKSIKLANVKILRLLPEISEFLDRGLIHDVAKLQLHLEIWLFNWRFWALARKPQINECFDFNNPITFPVESYTRILKLLELKLDELK